MFPPSMFDPFQLSRLFDQRRAPGPDKVVRGLNLATGLQKVPTGLTPKEVVWTKNKALLYHYLPETEQRHAGDLGNLTADNDGKAHYELTVKNISVAGTKNPVIGRGVIVHAKVDDGGQPVGNAGGRIACGVIGVANAGK